jgi:hypothetical protein
MVVVTRVLNFRTKNRTGCPPIWHKLRNDRWRSNCRHCLKLIVVCATDITATTVAVAVTVAAVVVLSLSPLVVRIVCQTTLMRWRWGAGGEKNTKKYLE